MSNIVFFGTPMFAVPALRALADSPYRPIAVITAQDKPFGRKKVLTPSPIALEAERLGIPVIKLASLKDDASWAQFEALKASLCVVVAYGKLIPQRYLDAVPHGWLNIHPSLLPQLRGPSPVATAILNGISESGISLMLLDAQQDHGPVVASRSWIIDPSISTPEAEQQASELGAQLLLETLPAYLDGSRIPQPQDDALATHTKKFTRDDGRIQWNAPAATIINQIRALGHNPGTWTTWNNKTLNIHGATLATVAASTPGTVAVQGSDVLVSCADTCITINELQLEGSTRQQADAFVRGRPDIAGATLY